MSGGGSREPAELYAEFLARDDASFEEFVARHPEHASELRKLQEVRGLLRDAQRTFHRKKSDVSSSSSTSPLIEAREGVRLGDFRLIRRLGRGGMGEVWEAKQITLGRHVALKLIRPDRVTPKSIRFFDREARAGSRLSHPGVVAVYAAGGRRALLEFGERHGGEVRRLTRQMDDES